MKVLGFRFSNKDFTYVVLSGRKKKPKVEVCNNVIVPPTFINNKARAIYWTFQEVESLIKKYGVQKIVMKGFEGLSRNKSFEQRIELETAVYLAGGNNGFYAIYKKGNKTIAKDFGLKGKASSLKTELDTSVIQDIKNFDERSEKEIDAIRAAWSELP